jgi:hypothetical protein
VGGALGLGAGGTPSAAGVAATPAGQLVDMQQVAATSHCGLPWPVLAAVAGVESSFGQNMATSSVGAMGYGQFTAETWAAFGAGGNPYDYHDALPAMDRYLCALAAQFGAGLPPDEALKRALFFYSHRHDTPYDPSDSYVRDVLGRAANYTAPAVASGGGLVPGWEDRPALHQFDCANYRSASACATWQAAACSAAALKWLLGAYAVRLGGIDDAVALIGPGTGISTSVGLLDSRGPRLAAAVAAEGLSPRRAQLGSTAELRSWLGGGPLLLDGHRWFGEGHWFVAIGSDDGGIFIRESSGHDVRYLTWARLYGEVGWSGWAVGVAPAVAN